MDILSIATSSYRSIAISSTLLVVISYLIYVRQRRYKHLHNMIKKYPDPRVVLENHDIAMEIYSDIFRKEFPRNLKKGGEKKSYLITA